MALTEERKALLFAYCREDPNVLSKEEQLLMEMFYEAAEDYMMDAGVALPTASRRLAKYSLVVFAMTLNAWDRRDLTEVEKTAENPAVRKYINQLKLSEPVTEE